MKNSKSGPRSNWYVLVVFLSSAIVMVLELSAGRLLAPYLGVSLYTWTSVIGVVLAGLSLGSYLGGLWADKGAGEKSAGMVLLLAGIFAIGILGILYLAAPVIQSSQITLLSASFLYMLLLFLIPATLLGIIVPLLITLGLKLDSRTGHVVGRMHALGALGSILGTFITGYWLIQTFGTRVTIVGCGIVLICLAAPFLLSRSKSLPILLSGISGLWYLQDKIPTPCEVESSYYCLRTVDVSEQAPTGKATALVLDHLMHGINHASEPELLISPYVQLMYELPESHFADKNLNKFRYFFAGGGAYTQPRAISARYPDSQITVAEIDPAVTSFAKYKLYFNQADTQILHQDARLALKSFTDNSFDVIISDVFHDISIPYHLLTAEYAKINRAKLKHDGLYMANLVDAFPDPKLVKAFVKTLKTSFKHVSIWLNHLPQAAGRKTYVVAANNKQALPARLHSKRGIKNNWFNITEPLLQIGEPLNNLPLLTDDYVPVERLISSLLLSNLSD